MSANLSLPLVVVTGPPGIGKTTLVRKLLARLQDKAPDAAVGFYTAEQRDSHGNRTGFNIITTDGQQAPLAFIQRLGIKKTLAVIVGIGKTTLVRKLLARLQDKTPDAAVGFYTAEQRDIHGNRTGFNIITTDGQQAPLAFIQREEDGRKLPMVGRYAVDVTAFKRVALPLLTKATTTHSVLVIDEVGKMELLSEAFSRSLSGVLSTRRCALLLTIPVPGRGKPIPLVEHIRKHPDALLVTLNRSNRNDQQLLDHLYTVLSATIS
ncbi:Nucleoside-triphosphatase THEP1 type [Trinorchestia longiramus]|nr:Nucleoside-triphosphatase THEP1 type [Trinorchestia longiramus]